MTSTNGGSRLRRVPYPFRIDVQRLATDRRRRCRRPGAGESKNGIGKLFGTQALDLRPGENEVLQSFTAGRRGHLISARGNDISHQFFEVVTIVGEIISQI